MLTKEEIKNLRMGDEIWVDGKIEEVTGLGLDYLWTCKTNHHLHNSLMNEDCKYSLNPPKKMKKFWIWSLQDVKGGSIYTTDYYFDENFRGVDGCSYSSFDFYFKQKLDYTMIEIEVE